MSWMPRFSIGQCLIGAVLVALLITWAKQALSFEAQALLHVKQQETTLAENARVKQNAIAVFDSPAVIELAIASFTDPIDHLMASRVLTTAKASYVDDSQILRVSVKDWNSESDCILAVDALCQAYFRHSKTRATTLIQSATIVNHRRESATRTVWILAALIGVFVLYGETLWNSIRRA